MRATQVLGDCPACKVEAAFVELIDPSERVPVPLEGRCRLCGHATELGEVVRFGHPFVEADEVIEALARWAREDGEPDVHAFVAANFGGLDAGGVAARVIAGERVGTSFDVIAWLFPQGSHSSGGEREGKDTPLPALRATLPPPSAGRGEVLSEGAAGRGEVRAEGKGDAPPAHDPRDVARALASVMVADGRVRPGERRFLDRALAELGAPPLDEHELRVWRPNELGPMPDAAKVLRAMRLLALVDKEADGSEARVLREYARAWRVELPAEALARPNAMAQLGRALIGLFVR